MKKSPPISPELQSKIQALGWGGKWQWRSTSSEHDLVGSRLSLIAFVLYRDKPPFTLFKEALKAKGTVADNAKNLIEIAMEKTFSSIFRQSWEESKEMWDVLFEYGLTLSSKTDDINPLFVEACMMERMPQNRLAQYLWEKGADLNQRNNCGEYLIHRLSHHFGPFSIEWFLDNGVDASLVTQNLSPIDPKTTQSTIGCILDGFYGYSDRYSYTLDEVSQLIKKAVRNGADPWVERISGESTLHQAVRCCPRAVPVLMELGGDIHAENKPGQSHLDCLLELQQHVYRTGYLKRIEEMKEVLEKVTEIDRQKLSCSIPLSPHTQASKRM